MQNLLWQFNTSLKAFSNFTQAKDDSIKIVELKGEKVMKVTINAGEDWYGTSRAEAVARTPKDFNIDPFWKYPDAPGSERWYSFSVFVTEDFIFTKEDFKWMVITQMKGRNGGSPPLAIEIKRNTFRMGGTMVGKKFPDTLVPVKKGAWNTFLLGVKWSSENDGWYEATVNGKKVIPRTSMATLETINGLPDPVYFKQGIYRDEKWDCSHTLYFKNSKIGRTKESVMPSNKKQDAKLISTEYHELKQAAKHLGVKEWEVLRAIQELKTNSRRKIYKIFKKNINGTYTSRYDHKGTL